MKKILLFIIIMSLSLFVFSEVDDDTYIDVNVEVKTHVTSSIHDPDPNVVNYWDQIFDDGGYDEVEWANPELRDGYYSVIRGDNVDIRFNTNDDVVIKSRFVINNENMDMDFLNGEIEGFTAILNMKKNINTDSVEKLPLKIVHSNDANNTEYTKIIRKLENNEMTEFRVGFNFKIRFTDENWYLLKAGEINLGNLEVIIESPEPIE